MMKSLLFKLELKPLRPRFKESSSPVPVRLIHTLLRGWAIVRLYTFHISESVDMNSVSAPVLFAIFRSVSFPGGRLSSHCAFRKTEILFTFTYIFYKWQWTDIRYSIRAPIMQRKTPYKPAIFHTLRFALVVFNNTRWKTVCSLTDNFVITSSYSKTLFISLISIPL